ncbi:hypothetical protein [Bacillus sp. SB49]|uniref:hypothetical protein n=1 Tax=Bacillus sp. SB49 TaxID=1071080 RepID=UPI001268D7CD|nr:hypothetical protein [Bacillus sp. SB49]
MAEGYIQAGSFKHRPGSIPQLPPWRKKNRYLMPINRSERIKVAEEMMTIAGSPKWLLQSRRTFIKKGRKVPDYLPFYESMLHLAGGVGVGKNALIEEALYRIYKEERQDGLTCVVVHTIDRANQVKKLLDTMGIRSVVVSGVHNKASHYHRLLEKEMKTATSLTDILKSNALLESMDNDCLIKSYHQVEGKGFPCLNNQLDLCPYAGSCNQMKPYREMAEASVWITVPQTLIKTKLPHFVDPLKRILQQAVHDLADYVFLDEVDSIQAVYDDSSVDETPLTGSREHFIYKLNNQTQSVLNGENQKQLSKPSVKRWSINLWEMSAVLSNLNGLLHEQEAFAERYLRKKLHLNQLIAEITDFYLWESEEEKGEEKDQLLRFFFSSDKKGPSAGETVYVKNLKEYRSILNTNPHEVDEERQRTLENYFIDYKPLNNRKQSRLYSLDTSYWLLNHLKFVVYLDKFETLLKRLVYQYWDVVDDLKLERTPEVDQLFGRGSKLFTLLDSVVTAVRYGYQLRYKQQRYELSLLTYHGKARDLLIQWQDRLEEYIRIKQKKEWKKVRKEGPCVVMLSGTSWAQGSPHSHVAIPAKWKLLSEHKPPSIELLNGPVPTQDAGFDYISVSGSGGKREENLKDVADHYIKHVIPKELDHWKREGDKRAVLVVVNSYEEARVVAGEFRKHRNWKGRFGYLTKHGLEVKEGKGEAYLANQLEDIPEYGLDVVIAPLSVTARGHNMLQRKKGSEHKSYFGSACLFVRPYYYPGDMVNIYTLLHDALDKIVIKLNDSDLRYEAFAKKLRKETNTLLRRYISMPMTFKVLEKNKMVEQLCWYTLVLVIQLTGRMQRGDTASRVILADAKFDYTKEEDRWSRDTSMVAVWKRLLKRHEKNEVLQALYGPFYTALKEMEEYYETGSVYENEL